MRIFNPSKAWTRRWFLLMAISLVLFVQCSDDDKDKVKDPVASFELINEGPMWVGDVIDFANLSKDADEYLWDFGDGTTSTEMEASHVYTVAEDYTVSLTVTNDNSSHETTLVVTILPYKLGGDITTQLRADLESGKSVELIEGTYYVSESILIENYTGGTIRGAGIGQTIIETAPEFKAPHNRFTGGEIAGILEFEVTKGDVTISDMTILVQGDKPAEQHLNPFTGTSTNMDNIFVVGGGGISVRFENLHIIGEAVGNVSSAYNGYNMTWPLIVTGNDETLPINLDAVNCTIEGAGNAAIEYWIPNGGVANIENCVVKDSYHGIWIGNDDDVCHVTVEGNDFLNTTYPIYKHLGITQYCFQDNTQDGEPMTDDCNLN